MSAARFIAMVMLGAGLNMVNAAFAKTSFLRSSLDTGGSYTAPARISLLEIWVNDRNSHVIAHAERRDGRIYVRRTELDEVGIRLDVDEAKSDTIEITGLAGIRTRFDDSKQRLYLTAGMPRLLAQGFDLRRQKIVMADTPGTGLIASYEVSVTATDLGESIDTGLVGASLGLTFFSPLGSLNANGFTRTDSSGTRAVRLDTAAEFNEADAMRRWIIGDLITGGLDWNRSVRLGGFQVASDFSLQPGFSSMALPDFFGQTVVPANVEVFVNSARVFGADVAPGPFELRHLPVLTGAGEARIVVKDELGRETVESISLYASNRLLGEGLWTYAFDAGAIRRSYGQKSFSYGDPAATGTVRHGVTNWLTLEGHAEASQQTQLIGAGAALSAAPWGVIGLNFARSRSGKMSGALYGLSLESRSKHFGLFGSWNQTSGHYRDLATLGGGQNMRRRAQLGANISLADGTLAASYVDFKDEAGEPAKALTASFTHSFASGWYFSTTGFYDYTRRNWRAEAFLSIPIGGDIMVSAAAGAGSDAAIAQASVVQSPDPDGGIGWRVSTLQGPVDRSEAGVSWYGDKLQLDGAVSTSKGRVAGQAMLSGGIVWMAGSIFTTQRPDGAVALVRTGQPGVKVLRENRLVGVSDEDGEVLLTRLTPNVSNRIAVDVADYPITTQLDEDAKTIVPPRRSGMVVDLAPEIRKPLLVMLSMPDGNVVPMGASVRLAGRDEKLVVGRGGKLFVPDLRQASDGVAEWQDGGHCAFTLSPSQGDVQAAMTKPVDLSCWVRADG